MSISLLISHPFYSLTLDVLFCFPVSIRCGIGMWLRQTIASGLAPST